MSADYPELSGNFLGEPSADGGVSISALSLPPGNYAVGLSLEPIEGAPPADAWCFLGRRTLAACVPASADACEVRGAIHVGRFLPRGAGTPARERLHVTVLAPSFALTALRVQPAKLPTLHIAGDSTVTDQPAEHPYHPMESYAGWGQMLPCFFSGRIAVANHAHSGLTTESFRAEGHYAILLDELRPGDYVMLQFGHNDQKLAHLAASGGYSGNLLAYIREIRKRGAFPLLVTPLSRNTWATDGRYNDLLDRHAAAVRALGDAEDVPVLSLHERTAEKICALGQGRSSILYHPGDLTHLNDCGAFLAAGIIADELSRVCRVRQDAYGLLASLAAEGSDRAEETAAWRFAALRAKSERTGTRRAEEAKRDVVPADLTGPAVWRIDDDGILRNPDGSLVPPP